MSHAHAGPLTRRGGAVIPSALTTIQKDAKISVLKAIAVWSLTLAAPSRPLPPYASLRRRLPHVGTGARCPAGASGYHPRPALAPNTPPRAVGPLGASALCRVASRSAFPPGSARTGNLRLVVFADSRSYGPSTLSSWSSCSPLCLPSPTVVAHGVASPGVPI
jgi:hypothetical protein